MKTKKPITIKFRHRLFCELDDWERDRVLTIYTNRYAKLALKGVAKRPDYRQLAVARAYIIGEDMVIV